MSMQQEMQECYNPDNETAVDSTDECDEDLIGKTK